MTTSISPAKLLKDDFSGEWSEDMENVFRTINKFSTDASGALGQQVLLSSLGAQRIQLNAVNLPPLWTAPTLASTVTNLGGSDEPAGYYKDIFGVVHVRGEIVRSTVGAIFTLPTAYRPPYQVTFPAYVDTGGTLQAARLDVTTGGLVSIKDHAPSTWGGIRCTFECADLSPGIPSCFPIRIRSSLKTGLASTLLLGPIVDQNQRGGKVISLGQSNISWHNETGFDGTNPVNSIVIDNIPGLIASHTYSITIWALPKQ